MFGRSKKSWPCWIQTEPLPAIRHRTAPQGIARQLRVLLRDESVHVFDIFAGPIRGRFAHHSAKGSAGICRAFRQKFRRLGLRLLGLVLPASSGGRPLQSLSPFNLRLTRHGSARIRMVQAYCFCGFPGSVSDTPRGGGQKALLLRRPFRIRFSSGFVGGHDFLHFGFPHPPASEARPMPYKSPEGENRDRKSTFRSLRCVLK